MESGFDVYMSCRHPWQSRLPLEWMQLRAAQDFPDHQAWTARLEVQVCL